MFNLENKIKMKDIILISKDALILDYLPIYGNKYWKTPNIDELAAKGTIFKQHYTAAPSTAMSFSSMFTGLYPYQLNRKDYSEVEEYSQGTTLFDEMYKKGYECHLLWSENYIKVAERFSKCYGKHTIRHQTMKLNQSVGVHIQNDNKSNNIIPDDKKVKEILEYIYNEIDVISRCNKPVFFWIHIPHVILGRCGYGQDIDLFDQIVGKLRTCFGDEGIYITADHGHMNGYKGKTTYGFDVYQPAIHIPLISPRIDNYKCVDFPTTNAQLMEFILDKHIIKRDFIVSDTQYYAQPNRKTCIIKGKYKYIYNKYNNSEELYDLEYDPIENINLLVNLVFDYDRNKYVNARQVLFYPWMDEANENYIEIKKIFNSFWETEDATSVQVQTKKNIFEIIHNIKKVIKKKFHIA